MMLLSKLTKRYLEDAKVSSPSSSRRRKSKQSSPMQKLRRIISNSELSMVSEDKSPSDLANEIEGVISYLHKMLEDV